MDRKVKTTSPKGTAQYPWLNTPDTKFDPEGVYKTNLVISSEDAQEFKEQIDDLVEQAYKEAVKQDPKKKNKLTKRYPYEMDVDDNGDETGDIIFKFKSKAQYTSKSGEVRTNKPKLVDSGCNLTNEAIFGGSILKVATTLNPYCYGTNAGVSLQIRAVQILELSQGSSGGDFGFSKEADGFIQPEVSQEHQEEPEDDF